MENINCGAIKALRRQLEKDGIPYAAVKRRIAGGKGYEIYIPCKEEPSVTILEEPGCAGFEKDLMTLGIHTTSGVEISYNMTADSVLSLIKSAMGSKELV